VNTYLWLCVCISIWIHIHREYRYIDRRSRLETACRMCSRFRQFPTNVHEYQYECICTNRHIWLECLSAWLTICTHIYINTHTNRFSWLCFSISIWIHIQTDRCSGLETLHWVWFWQLVNYVYESLYEHIHTQIGAVDWKHYTEYDADNFRAVHALLCSCFSTPGLSMWCSALQCVAVCCNMLQCAAPLLL